jgi:hypothetical protein
MIFDSLTSFLAAILGYRQIPAVHLKGEHVLESRAQSAPEPVGPPASLATIVLTVLVVASYAFLFDVFCTGAAAKMRVQFGEAGMRYFSQVMVINTLLCTTLAVIAARRLRNPAFAMPLGLLLTVVGCVSLASSRREWMMLGALLWSLGEVSFQALAPFVLLRVTAHSKRVGTLFGAVTLVQFAGRTLGAAAAFPVFVSQWHPEAVVVAVGGSALFVTFFLIPRWRALGIAE